MPDLVRMAEAGKRSELYAIHQLTSGMDKIVQVITDHLKVLEPIDHFTLGANLLILLLSNWFATRYGEIKEVERSRQRLRILHWANFILFATYLLAVIFEFSVARSMSHTFLVILLSYLIIHFGEAFILRKYGNTRTIEEVTRTTETHTSRTLELVYSIIVLCVASILLINIWGFEDWLQTTSVIGIIALFIFASKEYWAGDFLSGILIIGQGQIKRGDVIRVQDENVQGIVLQTNALHTIVRDLVDGHDVILPNHKLRRNRVDVLKTDLRRGIRHHVDFQIGYETKTPKVEEFFKEVWDKVVEQKLASQKGGQVASLKECGDHGVTWRLSFTLKSPHKIIESENAIREAAYDLQEKHGIRLDTPTQVNLSNPSSS